MRKAQLLQKRSDAPLMKVDAEALGDDALEVHAPPPHDGVDVPVGTGLDDLGQLRQLLRRQARLWPARPICP